ncbi:MAG: serine/threonine protein kinase [Myxococcales bacterium]|nr:serine/threonine protein kinase [Myxococcales bacterium]
MTSSFDEGASRDATLSLFGGAPLRSEHRPDVTYNIERTIGRGGFAYAALATRHAPEGSLPVVLKIMRPEVLKQDGDMVTRLFKKEVVALGRLNERVPPSPFVVRLLDTGVASVRNDGRHSALPWLAIEYVHGGVEGETLSKRVRYSVKYTQFAFDRERAARVLRQLAAALTEIHAAEIVHRDFKPSNVLACGFGDGEVVKVSDFGIARPTGLASTFGELALGTPGYVAPEQVHLRDEIGPPTDVFSLAAVVFFMLTGEKYFDVKSTLDGVMLASQPGRTSIRSKPGLSPELAESAETCQAIDTLLARATAVDPRHRFQSASELASSLQPWLSSGPGSGQPSQRLISSVISTRTERATAREPASWSWMPRQNPGGDVVVVDLAWESDGHCLAATARGLSFWDGGRWTELTPAPLAPIHMVRRLGAGRFLLSSDAGRLYAFAQDEAVEVLAHPDASCVVTAFSGDLDDLAVMVAARPGARPELSSYCGRHWLKPLGVEGALSIPGLARLDRERWLVAGRTGAGRAFAAIYSPLEWRIEVFASPSAPALVACASQPERGVAIAAGGRHVVRVTPRGKTEVELGEGPNWSACAVDVLGGEWVAGAGKVWFSPGDGAAWREVWSDASWTAPFVSMQADADRVVLVTADGGVLEGRGGSGSPAS